LSEVIRTSLYTVSGFVSFTLSTDWIRIVSKLKNPKILEHCSQINDKSIFSRMSKRRFLPSSNRIPLRCFQSLVISHSCTRLPQIRKSLGRGEALAASIVPLFDVLVMTFDWVVIVLKPVSLLKLSELKHKHRDSVEVPVEGSATAFLWPFWILEEIVEFLRDPLPNELCTEIEFRAGAIQLAIYGLTKKLGRW